MKYLMGAISLVLLTSCATRGGPTWGDLLMATHSVHTGMEAENDALIYRNQQKRIHAKQGAIEYGAPTINTQPVVNPFLQGNRQPTQTSPYNNPYAVRPPQRPATRLYQPKVRKRTRNYNNGSQAVMNPFR